MTRPLIQEPAIPVYPSLAAKIGLNESLILQQIHYWVQRNMQTGNNYRDGMFWTYNTYEQWHEQFPWCSQRTVQRSILHLEKLGLVISSAYNPKKYDKKKWYTIDYVKLREYEPTCQIGTMDDAIMEQPIAETSYIDYEEKENREDQSEIDRHGVLFENEENDSSCSQEQIVHAPPIIRKRQRVYDQLIERFGKPNTDKAISYINDYIDVWFPKIKGKHHQFVDRGIRISLSRNLLEFALDTDLSLESVYKVVKRSAVLDEEGEQTVFQATNVFRMGYYAEKTFGYDVIHDTPYDYWEEGRTRC